MDLERIISELRSERDDIELAILYLERRFDQPRNATSEPATLAGTEIRRIKSPDLVVLKTAVVWFARKRAEVVQPEQPESNDTDSSDESASIPAVRPPESVSGE